MVLKMFYVILFLLKMTRKMMSSTLTWRAGNYNQKIVDTKFEKISNH